MAYFDTTFYCNAGDQATTGHYAVAKFAASTAYTAGQLIRQLTAPAVGNERVFVVVVAGSSSTEPTWTLTRGAKTVSGAVTFMECSGLSAVNGDLTNTINWTALKAAGVPSLGVIIKRNNGASYQICTTAGTLGAAEPAFSDTAAVTTTETSATTMWTSLGPVGNFSGGGAPHARLANALATNWFVAGNTLYVGDNHAESQSTAMTITVPGSAGPAGLIGRLLCHDHSGSYPPAASNLTTGATATTTGVSVLNLTASGAVYIYGVTFKSGSHINLQTTIANQAWVYFDRCSLQLTSAGAGTVIDLGIASSSQPSIVYFNNTTVSFGGVGQYIWPAYVQFYWQNTGQILASGSSVPAALFNQFSAVGPLFTVVLEALDLSQLTGSLFASTLITMGSLSLKDCKLNAAMTVATPLGTGMIVQSVRSDSGGGSYKSARYVYEGTETTETTITRTGGAADPTGQAQSRKIMTSTNAQWLRPYKAEPYAVWNATTGTPVTVTVYGAIQSSVLPYTDELWMEVEYLSDTASPLGSIVSTTKSNLLAGAVPVAIDSSVWTGMLRQAETPTPQTTTITLNGTPSNVTMSNGNLTATRNSTAIGGVNSTGFDGPAVGNIGVKLYFEVTVQTSTSNGNSIGFTTPTDSTTAAPASGNNKSGVVLGSSSSLIYVPSGSSTGKDLGGVAINDVIGVAIDYDNSLLWFRKNGGNWNGDASANPATGAGGVFASIRQGYAPYVAFAAGSNSTDVLKANFGQVAFVGTPPSGFGASGGSGGGSVGGWFAFKLTTTITPRLAGYMHVRVRAAKASVTYYLDPKVQLS